MPVRDRYEAITKRGYKEAVIHLLESEYKLLGSHRVLERLAEDLEELHRTYYGDEGHMNPGVLCWRTQSLEDDKLTYGKRAEDYKMKTIYLPYVTHEDVEKRISHKKGVRNDNHERNDKREIGQMVRLLWSAYEQGTSLTIGELSVIMNRSLTVIGKYVKQYYADHPDKTLPLRGYILDQGSNPTHKGLICTLYERGVSEVDISRQTNHHIKSVGRYIKGYERVKKLVKAGMDDDEIVRILGMGKRVVVEYRKIVVQFYPELKKKKTLKTTKSYKKSSRGQMSQ